MVWIIYKTQNLTNHLFYIGMHKNKYGPYEFDGYLGSSYYLERDIIKLGANNFSRETLYVCSSKEEALQKEFHTIIDFISLGSWISMYNRSLGGKFFSYTMDENGYLKTLTKPLTDKNAQKLGVINVSQLQYVKDKIKETNMLRRGVEHVLQSADVKIKTQQTNLRKYGSTGNQKGKMHIRMIDDKSIASMKYKDEPMPEGWEKGSKIKEVE